MITAVSGLIIAITGFIGALAVVGVFSTNNPTPSQFAPASSTSTQSALASLTVIPTGATSTYVEDLQIVSGQLTAKGAINGFNHASALSDQAVSDDPQRVVFALPGRVVSFRAVVAFDPNSAPGYPGSGGARVLVDGRQLIQTIVSTNSPACGIDVSIDGGTRLELQAYQTSGEPKNVVFGDARVVASEDFPGEPSAPSCVSS